MKMKPLTLKELRKSWWWKRKEIRRDGVRGVDWPLVEETAVLLGVSYMTVHRLFKRGLLHSSSALSRKLIPASEIERFLKDTLE